MLAGISIILLFTPLIFQFTYGTRAIFRDTQMGLGKISLISFISQIIFSVASFSLSLYNFSKYFDEHPDQLRCGTPLVGQIMCIIFLICLLATLIVIQFILKLWKIKRAKSKTI